jgi:cell division septation protein DedD
MGTSALWQSTDQTSAYAATGAGSRRRVREFRVSSDTFAELTIGQAVVHTTLGPPPAICQVKPLVLPAGRSPQRIGDGPRSATEMGVHSAAELPVPTTKADQTRQAATESAAVAKPRPKPRTTRTRVRTTPATQAATPPAALFPPGDGHEV